MLPSLGGPFTPYMSSVQDLVSGLYGAISLVDMHGYGLMSWEPSWTGSWAYPGNP